VAGPEGIDDFIGQEALVRQVRVLLLAAQNTGKAAVHALALGPPGAGKSTIAAIIAAEMGSRLHERTGQVLCTPDAVNRLLMEAEDRDVVVIDEIHTLIEWCQVSLLRALENRTIYVRRSGGETMALPVAEFTLIGATTHEFSVLPMLRDRFKVHLRFSFYDEASLGMIVLQRAQMMRVELEPTVASEIAQRSRGVPRLAIRLLESCHRVALSEADEAITRQHFEAALELERLDELGLGPDEQAYLGFLGERAGQPIRLFTIEAALGIPRPTLQQVVEPFLFRMGLIDRTEKGRVITARGLEHLGLVNDVQVHVA